MATKKAAPGNYSKPKLREKLKAKILAGDKGGKPGQWSARKAQLLAHEYAQAGGEYTAPPTAAQKSLQKWTQENWTTSDHKKAERPGGTTRYLPEKAWEKLKPAEKKATERKKQAGSREGKQFVPNTKKAAAARKTAVKKTASKKAVKRATKKRQ